MKTIFVVALLCLIISSSKAQSQSSQLAIDSLKNEISQIKLQMNSVQTNLNLCHRKYKIGTTVMIVGFAVTGIALLTLESHPTSNQPALNGVELVVVGFGVSLIGEIIQIDSHKWIGRTLKK